MHPVCRQPIIFHLIEAVTSGPRSESLFHTQNTNFSAYLIAANLLRYRGARVAIPMT